MPYAAREDLERAAGGAARLVELSDWDANGVPDDGAIAAAQAKAEAMIDSYVAMRYAVPVAAPSAALVQVSADETIFQLKLRRSAAADVDRDERDVRFLWLERLAAGKVRPSDPPPPKSTAVKSRRGESMRDVSREKTRGYW